MQKNRSAPNATVVPMIIYADVAQAIDWLSRAFGFREHLRSERGGVIGHAQIMAGDGPIMLGRQGGPFRAAQEGAMSQLVLVHVDDVDAHHAQAKAAGAHIVQAPTDMPFGERQYTAQDYSGHWWTFSQHIADVAPEEWGARVRMP